MKYIADPSMHSMPAVTLAPNGRWLACQSMDNKIWIFSAINRYKLHRKKTFTGHMVAGYACGLDFSPEMRWVTRTPFGRDSEVESFENCPTVYGSTAVFVESLLVWRIAAFHQMEIKFSMLAGVIIVEQREFTTRVKIIFISGILMSPNKLYMFQIELNVKNFLEPLFRNSSGMSKTGVARGEILD